MCCCGWNQEDGEALVSGLLNRLMKSDKYGERRGAAFGLAGVVKGFGISCLKKYGIVVSLRDGLEDRLDNQVDILWSCFCPCILVQLWPSSCLCIIRNLLNLFLCIKMLCLFFLHSYRILIISFCSFLRCRDVFKEYLGLMDLFLPNSMVFLSIFIQLPYFIAYRNSAKSREGALLGFECLCEKLGRLFEP